MTALNSLGRVPSRLARRTDRLSDRRFAALSFLPGGLLVGLIIVPPILAVLVVSFLRIELLRDDEIWFFGLRNYARILDDASFLDAVPRTLKFAGATMLLTVPIALAAAMLLNRTFRGSSILGVAILLPWAVAPVVTGLYWKFIFQSQFGLVTGIANAVGAADGPVLWLNEPRTAMGVAVVATAWRTVPLMSILLLASLKTIPNSVYHAARMDGATAWQAFRHVTLPSIRNTLLVVGVLSLILSLQTFDVLFTLTGGGPGQSTTVIIYYIYRSTIGTLSFGYSSALAVFLFVVVALSSCLLLLFRVRRRKGTEENVHAIPGTPASLSPAIIAESVHDHDRAPLAPRSAEVVRRRRRRQIPQPVRRFGLGVACGVLLVWMLGPIVWIAIASVQPEGAVTSRPPDLTADLQLGRYADLLSSSEWQHSILVSVQITIAVTVAALVLGALAAYPLARLDLPGKRVVLGVLIGTQMVPAIVLAIPLLLMFREVGLRDTTAGLVIADVAYWLPLVIWLLRNVLADVPRSLEFAARIDGCSRLGALFRVLVPAAAPGFAAVAILLIIGTWNEFLFAVMLGDRNAVTVTRLIGFLDSAVGVDGPPPYTMLATAGIIAIAPCLLLVVFFHRRLVAGLTQGFVKG